MFLKHCVWFDRHVKETVEKDEILQIAQDEKHALQHQLSDSQTKLKKCQEEFSQLQGNVVTQKESHETETSNLYKQLDELAEKNKRYETTLCYREQQ